MWSEITLELESETLIDWTEGDYHLNFPLDTAQLIADMNLIDFVDRTDLIENDEEIHLLSDTLDNLLMSYIAYACVCPNWYTYGYEENFTSQFGGPCQYYIEPAHKDLEITVPFLNFDHTVRFIGKKYLKLAKDEDYGEASHGGTVF